MERWTSWEDGLSFTYEGSACPGVVTARNTWTIEPVDEHQVILLSRAQVHSPGIGALVCSHQPYGGSRAALRLEASAP